MKFVSRKSCGRSCICSVSSAAQRCMRFPSTAKPFLIPKYDLNAEVEPEQLVWACAGRSRCATIRRLRRKSRSFRFRPLWTGGRSKRETRRYSSSCEPFTRTSIIPEASRKQSSPCRGRSRRMQRSIWTLPTRLISARRDATHAHRRARDAATSTDWDPIGRGFTAVRGQGMSLGIRLQRRYQIFSDGNYLLEVLARWKARQTGAKEHLLIQVSR